MSNIKERRSSIRVGIKKLTSIVKIDADYEVIKGDKKLIDETIKIVDISSGGLCIESKKSLKLGVLFELKMPKIMHLESKILSCEVTRSTFREDPFLHKRRVDRDKSYYEIGLKFKNPNTEYLNHLVDLALAKKT